MNIFFFGQNGIFGQALVHQNARRVWALAQLLAERGNQVTIFTAKVHNPGKLAGIGHIRLVALPSFNPEKPGGWLYLLLGLRHIWHEQPEVVHIHGWKAAFLVRLAALLSPETAYVWTISALPQKPKWILKILYFLFCHGVFDAISTPSRQLQYRLLTEYKTRVAYIPDGYREPVLSNIPSKRWGRRHGQYCLAVVSSSQESKWIIEAYKQSKTRKKLLIVSSSNKADRGFMKKISSVDQLNIDYVRQSRAFSSLLNQAATVIIACNDVPTELLLQTMHAERAIIALPHLLYEETLGTTAHYVKNGDISSLSAAMSAVATARNEQQRLGTMARKRVQAHFQWPRIIEEYQQLYRAPAIRILPLDSVLLPRHRQTA